MKIVQPRRESKFHLVGSSLTTVARKAGGKGDTAQEDPKFGNSGVQGPTNDCGARAVKPITRLGDELEGR
jgi:hypothetical protein